ncbi:MAG: lipid-A-disaccharide synthase [Sphingobacteriaceae bacterium]|nr:lipid-A-disaccharide synthase [Cytophagaceae bacterium]
MKYFLLAGERSGDLHGANLLRAIQRHDPAAHCQAWGGDDMAAAGAQLLRHYRDLAFMGIWEVAKNWRTIRGLMAECQQQILDFQPDVVVFIDYGGFNLRVAKWAKTEGIRTFFYISPKVWAWNQKRAWRIKRDVDRLFVIFPFEVSFFKKYDYDVDYVGNPLFDAIAAFRPNPDFRVRFQLGDRPLIALLPGSRRQEVAGILPQMLEAVRHFPQYQFVVAGVSNLPRSLYDGLLAEQSLPVVTDAAYDLLSHAEAALVTSGTATLETALFGVPQVVCYRTSALTYAVGQLLIKVPFLSLVNLVAEREVVKELIQGELNETNLIRELKKITLEASTRQRQLDAYAEIRAKLGEVGASERAGKLMVRYLRNG